MSLLEKFQKITISLAEQIPSADNDYCRQENIFFAEAIKQLEETEVLAKEMATKQNNQYISISEKEEEEELDENFYPYVTKSSGRHYSDDKSVDYKIHHFGWNYVVRDCIRLKRKVTLLFIKRIMDYFTKTYSLELGKDLDAKILKLPFTVTWWQIVEMIREDMGGTLDFKGGAVEQAVEAFREHFKYKKPVQKGPIVECEKFFWWSNRGRDDYKLSGYNYRDQMIDLDKAISVYELEEVRAEYAFMYLLDKNVTFEWDAPLNGEKCTGIKFFKNGKMQLQFKDSILARGFINRFQLNSVNS